MGKPMTGRIVTDSLIYRTIWGDCEEDDLPCSLASGLKALNLRRDGGFDMRFKAARELSRALDCFVMAKENPAQ